MSKVEKKIRLFIRLSLLTLLLTSCLQTENSSSQDADQYGDQAPAGSVEFLAARSVFVSKCSNCHGFHLQTEDELIEANYVIPGSPNSSPLFYRMQNSSGAQRPKNMPPTGTVSENELQTVFDWIDTI